MKHQDKRCCSLARTRNQVTTRRGSKNSLPRAGRQVQYIAGGATLNTIRVAQWMLSKPGLTGFMGAIGSDDFGGELAA